MKYISSDSNIWLDFEAISRTELPFRLPYTYLMYHEALAEEILSPPGLMKRLKDLGLEPVEITLDEFLLAARLIESYVRISRYDAIALAIAKEREIPLLTGDGALRKAARIEGVGVIGTIGILDRLYSEGHIDQAECKYCLEALMGNKERRLPEDEIKKRLDLINQKMDEKEGKSSAEQGGEEEQSPQ